MCKNPRIEPVCDTVTTLNDNAMLVHVEELVIQKQCPLFMYQLTTTVTDEVRFQLSFSIILAGKIFKCIGKLSSTNFINEQEWNKTYSVHPQDTQYAHKDYSMVCSACTWIHSQKTYKEARVLPAQN
jgi:hypothetical protein